MSAIDTDANSIEIAREHDPAGEIDYLLGDFLTFPFQPADFDFVVCVAALHHMNATAALQRMRELLRAGGSLAILGLPRSRYPLDLPRDAAATIASRAYRLVKGTWESPAPTVWPPAQSFMRSALSPSRCCPKHCRPAVARPRVQLAAYKLTCRIFAAVGWV